MGGDNHLTNRIAVLMYHAVTQRPLSPFDVSTSTFTAHLDAICTAVTSKPSDVSIILTFDDGLISHYETVLPELATRGMSGLFFLSPGLIGTPGFMEWEHVASLLEMGMTIGSHSISHVNLALLDRDEALREMLESRIMLEDRLGIEIADLALPGGFAPRDVEQLATLTGYSRVFTSAPLLWDRYSMCVPRICLRETVNLAEVNQIIAGTRSQYVRQEQLKYAVRVVAGPRIYSKLHDLFRG
ncbi:MAG: polysaccharide deacetylase family protein [Bacillota bacterium]